MGVLRALHSMGYGSAPPPQCSTSKGDLQLWAYLTILYVNHCYCILCNLCNQYVEKYTQGNYATQDNSGMYHLMPRRHLPE